MGPVGQLKAQAMAPVDLIDEEFRLRSLRLGLGHNVNSPKLGTRKPCEYGLSVGILGCFHPDSMSDSRTADGNGNGALYTSPVQ